MADNTIPLRLRILIALTESLQQITIANGYSRDVNMVVRGRNHIGANEPVPCICITESPQQADISSQPAPDSELSFGNWELLLVGHVDDQKRANTDEAHYLLADVKKCLQKERERYTNGNRQTGTSDMLGMGGIITGLDFSPGIARPAEEQISPNSFFWLVLTLRFVEDNKDPYKVGKD